MNPFAGTEGQLLKLIQGLDKDRYEARFVVFKPSDFLRLNDFPIPVDVLCVEQLFSPSTWWKVYRYLLIKRRENFCLAHIFFNDASLIAPPLLRMLGYRIIVSRRDMGYWYTKINKAALKLNAKFVDRVIVNSFAVKQITIDAEGYDPELINVIYNGYQEVAVHHDSNEIAGGLDKDKINLVLVANIRPIKRMQDALYALGKTLRNSLSVTLTIIGGGDHDYLMKLAAKIGVEDAVYFLGSRDDVQLLLPSFDVGILCSESEGFSNALIEYQQSGLPIVCSNVGGNPEIVEHSVNGFLYETGNVDELSELIMKLCRDKKLRTRLGEAGRQKVQQNYSLVGYVSDHQAVYQELIRG